MKRKLYVTTSIPYVNAEPHVGHALELVQADVIARWARLTGRAVRFQTGTDENALKNVLAAEHDGITTLQLVDRNAAKFEELVRILCISADDFVRTTEARHRRGVGAFWRALCCEDLVQRDYVGLYCTGCEDFYLDRDLVDGKCPEHDRPPVKVAETNYFFALPRHQRWLADCLERSKPQVVPSSRRNEVLSFVRAGLREFSISRPSARMKGWGTPVPGDDSQTVYVWVDALINYVSALGFGSGDRWRDWWTDDVEKVHVIGKNVWKFHAVYWPALLRSAGLPLPDTLVVHGFLTVDGRKIGKSLGNAVDPFSVIGGYGADAVRYYLLRAVPPLGDGDFSLSRLDELYRTDLANGIGNLVSRLASLCAKIGYDSSRPSQWACPPAGVAEAVETFGFDRALAGLFGSVASINRSIERHRPWELLAAKETDRLRPLLAGWLAETWRLAIWLGPFLPTTSAGIIERLFSGPIRAASPLFPRL